MYPLCISKEDWNKEILFMRSRFSFSIAGIYFDLISVRLFWKEKKQFKMLIVFLPSFMADTKIIFGFNFVAPLRTKQDFFLKQKNMKVY